MGRSLAIELAPVRVNVIAPGLIQRTEAYAAMPEGERDAMIQAAAARLPAGRVGDGDSVADITCAVLASNYIAGTVIDIDGGGLIA